MPNDQISKIPVVQEMPGGYRPPVGLIGCGRITLEHLQAYRNAGIEVVAMCDRHPEKLEERRKQFFPDAKLFTDYRELLKVERIEVVDIATHPEDRVELIEASLRAGKHVLSQKPFVLDLDVGERLVALARQVDRVLAVNQNGRFAPHFLYLKRLVESGLLGQTYAARFAVHWDHTWTAGTPFESIKHLLLYDFGIHWFDMALCLLPGAEVKRVYASVASTPNQTMRPPLMAQAQLEFEHAQASIAFDGGVVGEPLDTTFLAGTLGNARSYGPTLLQQEVEVRLPTGNYRPQLTGSWFPDGFQGAMVELLRSIEERRACEIDARENLKSLAVCFAAIASAESGRPMVPGQVRQLPCCGEW